MCCARVQIWTVNDPKNISISIWKFREIPVFFCVAGPCPHLQTSEEAHGISVERHSYSMARNSLALLFYALLILLACRWASLNLKTGVSMSTSISYHFRPNTTTMCRNINSIREKHYCCVDDSLSVDSINTLHCELRTVSFLFAFLPHTLVLLVPDGIRARWLSDGAIAGERVVARKKAFNDTHNRQSTRVERHSSLNHYKLH